LSTTSVSAIAGCIADGATTAALAFDGDRVAAAIVTAAAASVRKNLRIRFYLLGGELMYRPMHPPYVVDSVALMSDLFRCSSPRWRQHGDGIGALHNGSISSLFRRNTPANRARLVPDVLPQ
jgi:hypothetical protein